MHYTLSPQKPNSNSFKSTVASPTTANSKHISSYSSCSNLMDGVRSQLNEIITHATEKKIMNKRGFQNVYNLNNEILAELDPQRSLRQENQELRRELNEALREILRLNKIIQSLEEENNYLKSKQGFTKVAHHHNDLFRDLQDLKAEGDQLRRNVIQLFRTN